MFVSELMTAPAVTVDPDASIKSAARLLRDRGIAAVPVVARDGALVGIVSELDLLRGTVLPDPVAHLLPVPDPDADPPKTVAEVMTRDVSVLGPHSDVYDAARLMRTSGVRSLPIVDEGLVVGVVSRADLLRVLAREDEEVAEQVRLSLRQELGEHPPWRAEVREGVVTLTPTGGPADAEGASLLARRVPGVLRVEVADGA